MEYQWKQDTIFAGGKFSPRPLANNDVLVMLVRALESAQLQAVWGY